MSGITPTMTSVRLRDAERVLVCGGPPGGAGAVVQTRREDVVAELAGGVPELDADHHHAPCRQLVLPSPVLRVVRAEYAHATEVSVHDARQGPLSFGAAVGGLVDEETNLVAVNAVDDLAPPSDTRKGGTRPNTSAYIGSTAALHGTNARGSVATAGGCSLQGRWGWAGGGAGAERQRRTGPGRPGAPAIWTNKSDIVYPAG